MKITEGYRNVENGVAATADAIIGLSRFYRLADEQFGEGVSRDLAVETTILLLSNNAPLSQKLFSRRLE